MSDQPPKPRDDKTQAGDAYRLASAGFDFFLMLIVPTGIGYWLDKKFGTGPWLLLSGVILGFIAGLVALVRLSNRAK